MSANDIIFYILAAFILGNGIMAMTTRKIFRSAIFLLFTLIGIAGLYFWMHVEFIAAVQIVVYVGGIVVLIIFSIFLTQQAGIEMPKASSKRTLFSILAVLSGLILTCMLISQNDFNALATSELDVSPANIGMQMTDYDTTGFALPFEVVSILLLAAMIGCIVIAIKSPAEDVYKNETVVNSESN